MMTPRPPSIIQVLIAFVVAPVLLTAAWEADTFFQEDDPWLAMVVLGALAVLAVAAWLATADHPEERVGLTERLEMWLGRGLAQVQRLRDSFQGQLDDLIHADRSAAPGVQLALAPHHDRSGQHPEVAGAEAEHGELRRVG